MKRSELYAAIWNQPISAVAHEFGVSDTWLRMVCRTYNVPVPPRGYWQKVHAGHDVQPLPLPAGTDVDIELTGQPQTSGKAAKDRSRQATKGGAASVPAPASPDGQGSRSGSVDISLEMALLERDARTMLRHRAMERLLVDLTAALAAASDLDPADWRRWVIQMQAEVQRRTPRPDIVEWAMRRFSGEEPRSR